jgi:hypothetical protein
MPKAFVAAASDQSSAAEDKTADTSAPTLGGPYDKVLALVIGNNTYTTMPKLRGAEADAKAVADVLQKKFGFQVRSLIGSEATAEAIRGQLAQMREASSSDTDVIIYFAGHGISKDQSLTANQKVADKDGFALPFSPEPISAASDVNVLRREAIEMKTLVADLMRWPARHRLVILDCCYSGLASKEGQVATLHDFDPSTVKSPSVEVITAGLDGQLSVENTRENRGVFTMALVDVLQDGDMQTLLASFIRISQKVINSPEYQADYRSGYPQHRLLSADKGEFVWLPLEKQAGWEEIVSANEMRAMMYPKEQQSVYGTATRSDEYQNTLKPKEEGNTTAAVLTPEDIKRYEARSSLGDPISMAILTEYYGRREDTASKARAHSYAVGSYETGSPYGTFALGRAYEKGYGVESNPELGKELQKLSGLSTLIELVLQYQELSNDLKNAKQGDVGSIVKVGVGGVSFLKRAGGFLGGFFAGSPDKQVLDGYANVSGALTKGNLGKATSKLQAWSTKLEKIQGQTDRQELLLDELKSAVAAIQISNASPSQQMRAYEEGITHIGQLSDALAASIKGGAVILPDLQKFHESLGQGNIEEVAKALGKLQKASGKLTATTDRSGELLGQLKSAISPLMIPVTPPSAQLLAYEKGFEQMAPLAEAFVDELAGPATTTSVVESP